jgi:arylsulfatase A-like enzyme
MSSSPNVLFFFTDDQRFDALGAAGNPEIHTPHLDALVASGIRFTHAHIPGGTSGAVCMPSRAMLHTGRHLFHLKDNGASIPPDHTTLGEVFRKAGYEVFGTGKWHNGREAYARSFSCGDRIFFGGMADHWNVPAYHYDPEGIYARKARILSPLVSNEVTPTDGDLIEPGAHSTDLFVDASLRFLEARKHTDPFFMYVSLMAPHDPRSMPERFLNMYTPEDITLPENFAPEHVIDTGALKIRDERLAAHPRNPEEIKRHIAQYYAMVTHLDDAFGRLMTGLNESGELENTLIVFAGDNGLALGQHGLMGKQNLYDHSVRVPLVMAGPGVPKQSQSDSLVYLLDIFPTLCDLCELDIPSSVEGRSFAPCLRDSDTPHRGSLYLAYEGSIRGITDGQQKLIEYAGGETQLFDLIHDPLEKRNLADEASFQDRLMELRTALVRHFQEQDDEAGPHGQAFWSRRPDLNPKS